MKTIKWSDTADLAACAAEAAEVLAEGGLVCLPCGGKYRLLADLTNETAVMRLMASKGRVRRAPALVFIDREERLASVAEEVDPTMLALGRALWPKPLTIRVRPSPELPSKVLKQLGGAKGKVGVRIPSEDLVCAVAARLGRPLLASSANKEARAGDGSPAQVRKSFAPHVDLFVDRGDLQPGPTSTVVEIQDGKVEVERAGAISSEELAAATKG
jgi:L-threonylcarbamoyladenylate synthase